MGKHKKESKKKHKKSEKKKSKHYSASSSSSEEERIEKRRKKKSKYETSSSESSSTDDEWVEKSSPQKEKADEDTETPSNTRDDWMSLPGSFHLTSNNARRHAREEEKRKERERQQYDPRTCPRELNPYWKDGGDGLGPAKKPTNTEDDSPEFRKPDDDYRDRQKPRNSPDDKYDRSRYRRSSPKFRKPDDDYNDRRSPPRYRKYDDDRRSPRRSNWRKSSPKFRKPDDDDERSSTRHNRDDDRQRSTNWRKSPPKFRKPSDDDDRSKSKYSSTNRHQSSSGWRKSDSSKNEGSSKQESRETVIDTQPSSSTKPSDDVDDGPVLSDKELNKLAAKLVKAEIMGNTELVNELKAKLEKAKRSQSGGAAEGEEVILTHTDSRGQVRPVRLQSDYSDWNKKKKQKVETHKDGERQRYFADDDKYSLKEMFENERMSSVSDQNNEFLKLAGKTRKNDDLDDIFTDNIRQKESDFKVDARNKDRAVNEHRKMSQSLDNCVRCIQSEKMSKNLMISMNETAYLALPSHEPLTDNHCLIVPIRHVPCGTQLDENEWNDIMEFRKAITKMFLAEDLDVIFFESAKNLNRFPHMYIECVPLPKEEGDMAPIYFRKAIDESETEWAQNKKLISMKGKDVRRAVPKGLPYFCVSFGLEEGFAHVIEDEQMFPSNFAQEIIGGMLDLHHSKWKRPKQERFEEHSKRVLEFSKKWQQFDCTNNFN